jgi:hypothetical protein
MKSKEENGVRMSWTGEDDLKGMRESEAYKGWWGLLDRVQAFIEEQRKDGPVEILQAKEKFGGLRVYVNGLSEEADRELWALLDESYKMCEVCGQSGKLVSPRGWFRTLCPVHTEEFKREESAR